MSRMHFLPFVVLCAAAAVAPLGCDTPTPMENFRDGGDGTCDPKQYPCGPFGNSQGQIIANLSLVGQRDTNHNGDPTDDPWGTIHFSDYYQDPSLKVLVVLAAAYWCVPCQMEQPELVQDFNTYKSKGVAFIEAIIQDNNGAPSQPSDVDMWAQNYKIPFDVAADPAVALGPYYNLQEFPMQMLITTKDMAINWQHNGYLPGAISNAIDGALSQ
jgi:hypothetical protein